MDATDATRRNKPVITIREATVRGQHRHVVFSRIGGKEKRTFFATRLEARLHRDALAEKLETGGTDAFKESSGLSVEKAWKEFTLVIMP